MAGAVGAPTARARWLPPAAAAKNPSPAPCSKIFVSLLAGCFTGISGITGYRGFIIYVLAHLAMGGLLLLKASLQPHRYFPSP